MQEMTKRFFTVDRKRTLNVGETYIPQFNTAGGTFCPVEGLFTQDDMRQALFALSPSLSEHGKYYLLSPNLIVANAPALTTLSPTIELVFELIRCMEFQHIPSRFSCMYGWSTIEDARKFMGNQTGEIFEVECNNYFRADMNLLKLGASPLAAIMFARKYWQGASSVAPAWEILLSPPVKVISKVNS